MNKDFIENNIMLIDNIVSQSIIIDQCFGCDNRIIMSEHNEERFNCDCNLIYRKVYDEEDKSFRLIADCEQRPDVLNNLRDSIIPDKF